MEIWKDIKGFEEYFQVSDYGRVWSKRSHRVLKPSETKTGYLAISTRIGGRSGDCHTKRIHRWVCEAFLDNPNNKEWVNHKDGNKKNNNVSNLEWCTPKENSVHAYTTGLSKGMPSFENPSSKLEADDVIYIRAVYTPRHKMFGARALSRELGISHTKVSNVARGVSYKDVV